MTRLSSRLTERIKGTEVLDRALRYNARYYEPVRKLLRELDGMDRSARRDLSDLLTRRALEWAADTPSGLPAHVPLADRPFTEKSDLRDHPERFRVRGLIRATASTSGATGIPVRLQRSLRSVASEQAFIDDQLGVWNLTFRTARIARMRVDRVKPVTDHEPPYGVRTHGGRQLVLSSNHLSPTTARWFHDELRRFAPDVLYTHPSSGEALARFIQKEGLSTPIPVVLTSSESLQLSGRLLMERVFQATVVDYYGQAERVAFAAGVAGGTSYFNPAYGRIELLPLDEAEAPTGYRAFEIVGTGFWNDAMPLVRYRTGDRVIVPDDLGAAELEDITLGLLPVLAIQGRDKEHLISPRGEVLVGITHASDGVKGLVRMQVVQDSPYAVRLLVVADPRVGRVNEAELINNVRQWLPGDMHVTLETVEQIERLPSGKTPFVVRRF
jgi:phenylacetate-coenzyme A ligase PaaK-like adenylate-forming protein